MRNNGTLPFLDDDAVIEVSASVTPIRIEPRAAGAAAAVLRGLIAHVSAYEELALDAAIRGGRDRVFDALLAHPLIGQVELADKLADALIAENRDFLPWAKTRAAVLAIDGGNSKTDVPLVDADGAVIASGRVRRLHPAV